MDKLGWIRNLWGFAVLSPSVCWQALSFGHHWDCAEKAKQVSGSTKESPSVGWPNAKCKHWILTPFLSWVATIGLWYPVNTKIFLLFPSLRFCSSNMASDCLWKQCVVGFFHLFPWKSGLPWFYDFFLLVSMSKTQRWSLGCINFLQKMWYLHNILKMGGEIPGHVQ